MAYDTERLEAEPHPAEAGIQSAAEAQQIVQELANASADDHLHTLAGIIGHVDERGTQGAQAIEESMDHLSAVDTSSLAPDQVASIDKVQVYLMYRRQVMSTEIGMLDPDGMQTVREERQPGDNSAQREAEARAKLAKVLADQDETRQSDIDGPQSVIPSADWAQAEPGKAIHDAMNRPPSTDAPTFNRGFDAEVQRRTASEIVQRASDRLHALAPGTTVPDTVLAVLGYDAPEVQQNMGFTQVEFLKPEEALAMRFTDFAAAIGAELPDELRAKIDIKD